MFVFGLVVGPIIGLVMGDTVFRSRAFDPRLGALVIGLVLIFLFFTSFLAFEVKLGLIIGVLLGLLLAVTPEVSPT